MYLLQKLYSLILDPVYRITGRISEPVRNMMVSLSCFGLCGFFIIYFTTTFKKILKNELTLCTVICSFMLFVMILFSLKDELKRVKWNKLLFWLFFISGAGVVAISFLHPIGSGYRAWGMLMMFGFPCLYYVWNNRGDYCELYSRLSAAMIIVGILYYIFCFYKAGKGELLITWGRLAGTFYDANMYSMIGMVMLSCSVYMLLVNRHSKLWFALTALGFGIGIDITWLGESRLSILSVLGSMFAFSIYYLKTRKDFTAAKSRKVAFLRAEVLLLSMIVFFAAGKLMLGINQQAMAAPEVTTTTESSESMVTEETSTAQQNDRNALDRFSVKGKDLNSFTAGRYDVWKGYAQFLNMTGNDFSKADWKLLTNKTVKHAHNNFLEIGYRCGIPVACLHLLLELMAGIICIIYLFSRKYRKPEYLFSIAFLITYAIQSMFDIATIPFERPSPFFFYMAMIPIFMFGSKTEEDQNEIVMEAAE